MSLTTENLTHVAHLARLGLSPADAKLYTEELNRILAIIGTLNAVDTEGVTPMAHPLDRTQTFREDAVTEPNVRDAALALAPHHTAGLFLVPQVIE